jgi:hypothetical protein
MKESEYSLVANLTRLRDVRDILSNTCFTDADKASSLKEIEQAVVSLIGKLENEIDGKVKSDA